MAELWNRSRWILLAAVLLIGGGYAWSALTPDRLPDAPLAIAPRGAQVVAGIDVAALTGSRVWALLLGESDGDDVRRVEATCGYDPLGEVERAVVFVFGSDDRPFEHVGFVARGAMARGEEARRRLARCVEQVVGRDGGALQRVEVEGVPAVSSAHGRSQAAFLGDDGVVGGDPLVVRRTLRVAQGHDASASTDRELSALYERVSAGREAAAVARLPARWHRLLGGIGGNLTGGLASILTARTLGVGIGVRRGLSVGGVARTSTPAEARAIESGLRAELEGLLEDRATRLSVVGTVLRRVEVQADGADVVFSASLRDEELTQAMELWTVLRASRRGPRSLDPSRRVDVPPDEAPPEVVEAEPGGAIPVPALAPPVEPGERATSQVRPGGDSTDGDSTDGDSTDGDSTGRDSTGRDSTGGDSTGGDPTGGGTSPSGASAEGAPSIRR